MVICRAADSNLNFKKCSEHSKEDATMLNHNKNVCFYRSIGNIIITGRSGRCTVKKDWWSPVLDLYLSGKWRVFKLHGLLASSF